LSDERSISIAAPPPEDDDGIDHSLAHLTAGTKRADTSKKGKLQAVLWDDTLEDMRREKAATEATRGIQDLRAL
jgi:hypothetical protein